MWPIDAGGDWIFKYAVAPPKKQLSTSSLITIATAVSIFGLVALCFIVWRVMDMRKRRREREGRDKAQTEVPQTGIDPFLLFG